MLLATCRLGVVLRQTGGRPPPCPHRDVLKLTPLLWWCLDHCGWQRNVGLTFDPQTAGYCCSWKKFGNGLQEDRLGFAGVPKTRRAGTERATWQETGLCHNFMPPSMIRYHTDFPPTSHRLKYQTIIRILR